MPSGFRPRGLGSIRLACSAAGTRASLSQRFLVCFLGHGPNHGNSLPAFGSHMPSSGAPAERPTKRRDTKPPSPWLTLPETLPRPELPPPLWSVCEWPAWSSRRDSSKCTQRIPSELHFTRPAASCTCRTEPGCLFSLCFCRPALPGSPARPRTRRAPRLQRHARQTSNTSARWLRAPFRGPRTHPTWPLSTFFRGETQLNLGNTGSSAESVGRMEDW